MSHKKWGKLDTFILQATLFLLPPVTIDFLCQDRYSRDPSVSQSPGSPSVCLHFIPSLSPVTYSLVQLLGYAPYCTKLCAVMGNQLMPPKLCVH
jgi:hypothetical protein